METRYKTRTKNFAFVCDCIFVSFNIGFDNFNFTAVFWPFFLVEKYGAILLCSKWERVLYLHTPSYRFLKYFSGCIQLPVGSMGRLYLGKNFDHSIKRERLLGNLSGTCDHTIEKGYAVDQKPEQQLTPNVRFMFHRKG